MAVLAHQFGQPVEAHKGVLIVQNQGGGGEGRIQHVVGVLSEQPPGDEVQRRVPRPRLVAGGPAVGFQAGVRLGVEALLQEVVNAGPRGDQVVEPLGPQWKSQDAVDPVGPARGADLLGAAPGLAQAAGRDQIIILL